MVVLVYVVYAWQSMGQRRRATTGGGRGAEAGDERGWRRRQQTAGGREAGDGRGRRRRRAAVEEPRPATGGGGEGSGQRVGARLATGKGGGGSRRRSRSRGRSRAGGRRGAEAAAGVARATSFLPPSCVRACKGLGERAASPPAAAEEERRWRREEPRPPRAYERRRSPSPTAHPRSPGRPCLHRRPPTAHPRSPGWPPPPSPSAVVLEPPPPPATGSAPARCRPYLTAATLLRRLRLRAAVRAAVCAVLADCTCPPPVLAVRAARRPSLSPPVAGLGSSTTARRLLRPLPSPASRPPAARCRLRPRLSPASAPHPPPPTHPRERKRKA
ncbi:uncharacterized protein [Oryza sativa Japonica Group]|uniref:uncharacterized protein n=1 Tax=Oryza sativa subsp. japonica TaxID=39947 RepID=UPI00339CC042